MSYYIGSTLFMLFRWCYIIFVVHAVVDIHNSFIASVVLFMENKLFYMTFSGPFSGIILFMWTGSKLFSHGDYMCNVVCMGTNIKCIIGNIGKSNIQKNFTFSLFLIIWDMAIWNKLSTMIIWLYCGG